MRFHLRTMLIVLALGPMVLAWYGWPVAVSQYKAWQLRTAIALGTPAEAKRLERQAELLLLAESWDRSALDAIYELAEIGDANVLPFLEKKWNEPVDFSGKFGTGLHYALAKIKERTQVGPRAQIGRTEN
jgi:hypothetical protein